jgi:hypothetical protein
MLTRLGAASSDSDSSINSNKELNLLQQHAMDQFLLAQTSGCPVSKEEKWRELVRAMKQPRLNRSRSRSSRGSRGSSSNRSYSNDEVLGFIRIGGGSVGGDSIASGLTSPTTSPMTSPYERKTSLPRLGRVSRSPFGRRRDRERSLDRSVGDDTLPTFPSLPGHHESSMGSMPTFPSLPGNRVSSETEETKFTLQRDSGITYSSDATESEKGKGVFLDIVKAANVYANAASKESSTWDSLLLSSNDLEDSALNTSLSTESSQTNSIVKNLVGRYETSINRSMSQNPSFFQRTNPTNNKEIVPTPQKSRVVSTSAISIGTATPQKEIDPSASTHKSRKSRRENSLEEQVRNVLERQQSHTVEESEDDTNNMSPSPSSASLPLKKPDILSRRVKSESVASAQDILAELRRSPTPPVGTNSKLPRSISVGGSKSPSRLNSPVGASHKSPPRHWNNSDVAASPDRMTSRSASPAALAPSRRDLPRTTRFSRKGGGSESNAANTVDHAAVGKSSLSVERAPTPNKSPPKAESPVTTTAVQSQVKPKNNVFPCTSPLTIGSEGSSKNIASSVKSNETPPVVSKPLVGLPPSKRDVPTVSSTRRLLPSVKEIAARFNGQMTRTTSDPNTPTSTRFKRLTNNNASPPASRSIASGGSKERIDEIRASITKLKHDGVGGIGKSTSTLVRNQETGRYIIRDVDDNSFDHIMLAEMMRPNIEINEQSPQEQHRVFQEKARNEAVRVESPDESAYIGDVNPVFRMPSQSSMTSSIRSDGVVDDAVRAAIDALSSTSTDDIMNEPHVADDDFFVVRSKTQWSSFQSPTSDNKQGSLNEDAFDIDPLNDWDDSGSDELRDGKGVAAAAVIGKNNGKANHYSSPTSVILGPTRKFMRDEIVASWDPFGM